MTKSAFRKFSLVEFIITPEGISRDGLGDKWLETMSVQGRLVRKGTEGEQQSEGQGA